MMASILPLVMHPPTSIMVTSMTTEMDMVVATMARTLLLNTVDILVRPITDRKEACRHLMVTVATMAPPTLPLKAVGIREALDLQTMCKATTTMMATNWDLEL